MSDRAIVSRAEAKALGMVRYYTGPCKRGHDAERLVGNRSCVECALEKGRKYREANREKERDRRRQYRDNNPEKIRLYCEANSEKIREYRRKHQVANREKRLENERQRHEANPEQRRNYYEANSEKILERVRQYRKSNQEKIRQYNKTNSHKRQACKRYRQARKLQATPGWFDKAAVEAIYKEAARLSVLTGVEHHVDHIIPLRGKNVCGLHVQNNLMAIPRDWNASKSAKLIEDYDAWMLEQMLRAA